MSTRLWDVYCASPCSHAHTHTPSSLLCSQMLGASSPGDSTPTQQAQSEQAASGSGGGGRFMRWIRKKTSRSKKRRGETFDALQPHQVYIMKQAFPALLHYFGRVVSETTLERVAAPLPDLLELCVSTKGVRCHDDRWSPQAVCWCAGVPLFAFAL